MTTTTGVPLGHSLTAANVHDLRQLLALVFLKFPRIGGKRGRPLDRPLSVTTDKAYDCQDTRELLESVAISPNLPRRGASGEGALGASRWPIERTLSWLKQFRRLRIRWDRLEAIHQAFYDIACSIITWRYLIAQ